MNPAANPVSLAIAAANALLLLDLTLVVAEAPFPVPVGTGVVVVGVGILLVNGRFVTLLAPAKTGICVAKLSTGVPDDEGLSTLSITWRTPLPIMISGASSWAELMKTALLPVREMVSFPPSRVVKTVLLVKEVE